MSWNPTTVENISPLSPSISPLSPRSRRPSQIPRKPVANSPAALEVTHVPNHYGSNYVDSEGVSPVSRLSSGLPSSNHRVTSSYFSPDSVRFSRNLTNARGARPLPFLDLDANEAGFRTEQVTDHSDQGSSGRSDSEVRAHRDTYTSVYSENNEHGLGANAYPSLGMCADEAAYLANSAVTSEVGSLHRGLEQSIIEARQEHEIPQTELGMFHHDQTMRETRAEQTTDQVMSELPGMDFHNPAVEAQPSPISKWLPISLRWWFMALLFSLSLGLFLAALFLTIRSHTNQGLGTERDTSAFLFTRKFVPTLFAVIYTALVMVMITDIRRTEPYARLSRPAGAPASTLFLKAEPLWSDPFTTLRKTTNSGVRNWALFWAALINILSLLLIVPFSAAFIYPSEVVFNSVSTYSRLRGSPDTPLKLLTDDAILSRTISSELLNTTTSVWVSNDYAVLPFWPSDQQTIPLGGFLPSPPQQWTANTTVYQADLECDLMSLHSFATFTSPATSNTPDANLLSFVIGSDDGCSFGLAGFPPGPGVDTIFGAGGGWWSGPPNFDYPLLWPPDNGAPENSDADRSIMLNTTTQCGDRSLFFVAEPYVKNQPFKVLGQVCTSSYYSASLPVTVSNTESSPSIIFDTKVFESAKKPITSSALDIPAFESSFLNQNWATKFQFPSPSLNPYLPTRPKLGGPLSLLGAKNDFSTSKMLATPNLTTQARQIKQRFLGESMMSSFHQLGAQKSEPVKGTNASIERRIFVSLAAGIMLAVALLVSTCMLLLVAFHTRLNQRPLNLLHDPGSLKVMASLISSRPEVRALFEGTDRDSEYFLRHKLAGYVLYLKGGELRAQGINDVSQIPAVYPDVESLESNTWCPKMLRTMTIRLFLAWLVIIILVLGVLYGLFHRTAISHSPLVPESSQVYTKRAVTALAPYSVIPTLISAGIMLYWASMATTIGSLQPYVSMARKPIPVPQNPFSFLNMTRLWTVGSAAWNREVLLSTVAACAVLSQVLTVTMSGLWESNPAFQANNISVWRSEEFRTVPAIFTVVAPSNLDAQSTNSKEVLSNIFGSSLTSWMFSAMNEGVYNSTPPSWTNQDWAFAPLNLTSVQKTQDTEIRNNASHFRPTVNNITVQTPSLRGSLECIPIDMSNTSAWLATINITDKTVWNNSLAGNATVGYEINLRYPLNGSSGQASYLFNLSTADYQMPTYGMDTNSSEEAAIGYWTHSTDDPHASIVVQWITGYPIPYQIRSPLPQNQQTRWIWKDIPKVAALKCLPVFESAIARVNVDVATGAAQNFEIMNKPSSDLHAWSSRYQALNISSGVQYSSTPGVGAGFQSSPGIFLQNISVSYGYLFHDIILEAANPARITGDVPQIPSSMAATTNVENITDRTFRLQLPRLSVDFMSYTSLALSGNNKSTLLDPTTLGNVSSAVFSTFFKNFVKAKVSDNDALFINGSWGLQPLGAIVPSDLGPVIGSNPTTRLQNSLQLSTTNSTAEGILRASVEILDMNHAVAIICLCILSVLIATIVGIMLYSKRYLEDLPRNMDNVGSVLALVYGSERLLELTRASVSDTEQLEQKEMFKMGWFEVGQKRRWGIEVVQPGDRLSKEFVGADTEVRLSN